MPKTIVVNAGDVFGRLKIIKKVAPLDNGKYLQRVECECACGAVTEADVTALVSGVRRSCGCLRVDRVKEINTRHGDSKSPEHVAWLAMIYRCGNPNSTDWDNYGGRGIKVCEEWLHDYPAFLSHVGRKPSPSHSIDRYPDRDGDYRPGNVRWATPIEQARNRRPRRRRAA